MNNRKIAIYIRVASVDADSLTKQERIMIGYAAEHGCMDAAVYRDIGVSGLTLDRPGMSKLLEDIENGLISAVIVKDLSRVARNIQLIKAWRDFLKENNVELLVKDDEAHETLRDLADEFSADVDRMFLNFVEKGNDRKRFCRTKHTL